MNSLKPYFTFTASQRNGILVLLCLIAVLQCAIFALDGVPPREQSQAKRQWLALQPEIDQLKKQQKEFRPKIYPFNPNFITDFKGYKLGMSTAEIDRLLAFRKQDRYVNSAREFQCVTKVSDSLLAAISPYFKFPDWVNKKKRDSSFKNYFATSKTEVQRKLIDINSATQDELMKVYGIGPALSERIMKQRETLGGFVSMEQMNDIWGLSVEVVEKLNAQFKIGSVPEVKKVAINDASVKVLSQFPYFRYPISKNIVTYRSMNGRISNTEDLLKIPNFPVEKVNIIAVYLEF